MMENENMKAICEEHINRYVLITMEDQKEYDGIIELVDEEHLHLAVPIGAGAVPNSQEHGFGYGYEGMEEGYYPGMQYYHGFGQNVASTGGHPTYSLTYRPQKFQHISLALKDVSDIELLPYY